MDADAGGRRYGGGMEAEDAVEAAAAAAATAAAALGVAPLKRARSCDTLQLISARRNA